MTRPALLLKTLRSNHTDLEFFGFLGLFTKDKVLYALPELSEEPVFLRSLAKPLQASVMVDLDLRPRLTPDEVAITCASHVGEKEHVRVVKRILNKFNLDTEQLRCNTHAPLSLKTTGEEPINNNCSGKHALMLALCVDQGWSTGAYLEFNHPLQRFIYKKHKELCEYEELVLSYDSCGTPIYGLPLRNIAKGYLNLFLDEEYKVIRDAFLRYPVLIGGKGRTDTKIMRANNELIAKVGAGGLLAVLNLESREILLIKMSQENNQVREVTASKILMQLGWIGKPLCSYDIFTFAGKKVGEYVECYGPLR